MLVHMLCTCCRAVNSNPHLLSTAAPYTAATATYSLHLYINVLCYVATHVLTHIVVTVTANSAASSMSHGLSQHNK